MKNMYVSGVCILIRQTDGVKGCLFNEFGITLLDFYYDAKRDNVKLHSVMKKMDKWYIRRVLRSDLRALIHELQHGCTTYEDKKHNIYYSLTVIEGDSK
jgi:hypothetical protein